MLYVESTHSASWHRHNSDDEAPSGILGVLLETLHAAALQAVLQGHDCRVVQTFGLHSGVQRVPLSDE